jgi:hypothetical protein
MYILCIEGKEDQGAYAISGSNGDQCLLIFEELDDAERYIGLLEAEDFGPLVSVEVDGESMIAMCEKSGYQYLVIPPDELIIPPSHNTL